MGPLTRDEIFHYATHLPLTDLIDLSMKINEEIRNRQAMIDNPVEVTDEGISSLESQLMK